MAKKGVTKKWLPAYRSRRINVLGFMKADRKLTQNSIVAYEFEGIVDAPAIVACFDLMAEKAEKETWVVIDNAPQHTSKLFKSRISEWEKKNLYVKYLPPYSPELNRIEILWRFIKYQWLQIKHGMTSNYR